MRRWLATALAAALNALPFHTPGALAGASIMKTEYRGWHNCYRLTNGQIELIATQQVGPRIIRFAFVGADNVFAEYPDQVGQTGGDEWRIYGGHRLWHAPEAAPRTYCPDNSPIEVKAETDTLSLIQPTEPTTGIQKTIEVTMRSERNQVTLVHRLRNNGPWPVELAPWALSVMRPGGMAIIPQPPYVSHQESLLPARPIVQWSYTDMSDPRWRWGAKYITLRQDPAAAKPQKIGVGNRQNWIAYQVGDNLFVKTFRYIEGATYPDFGCTVEVFTNQDMLEVETLGPLTRLEPGQAVEHVENWFLFRGVAAANDDAALDASVLPQVEQALRLSSLR